MNPREVRPYSIPRERILAKDQKGDHNANQRLSGRIHDCRFQELSISSE